MSTLHSRFARRVVTVSVVLATAGCGGKGSTPTQPSEPAPAPAADLSGAWTGTASDSSGPGRMSWQVSQAGRSLTGSLSLTDTATGVTGRGTLSGQVNGSTAGFSAAVPVGGFDSPYGSCAASVSGQVTVSGSSLTGTYSGSNTCSGAIASGQLTLTRS